MRREWCGVGKDRKFQGNKSEDAEKLGVPNGKVPKFEDVEQKEVENEREKPSIRSHWNGVKAEWGLTP
jgi:hypothetical protein